MAKRGSWLSALLAFVAYVAAGKAGLALAILNPSTSPVWPPTGIAIAAFLLLGHRAWLPIALGAFLVNWTTTGIAWTSAAIAAGNALEGFFAAALTRRFGGGAAAFDDAGGIFRFTALGALLSTTVSATVGLAALELGGLAELPDAGELWLTWWLGNAAGALLVTPLIVLWARSLPSRDEAAELGGFLAATCLLGWPLFGVDSGRPITYLFLPLVVAAAYRLGPRGAITLTGLIAAIAVASTLNGHGPFVLSDPNTTLLALQGYLAILSLTGLVLGALSQELRRAKEGLESAVEQRTGALKASETRLSEAQRIAHVGSWQWDVDADRVTWSDELYRMHGLDPQSVPITYQSFLSWVHPDDRGRMRELVEDSLTSGQPYEANYRILRDRETRTLHARGRPEREDERVVRMQGTAQDVTERLEAENALRRSEEGYRLLADHATDVITRLDPAGVCLYASPAVRAMTGYPAEDVIGRSVIEFVDDRDVTMINQARRELLKSTGSRTVTWRLRRRDGSVRWIETTARPVREDRVGRVVSVVAVSRDVTGEIEAARRTELLFRVTALANETAAIAAAMKSSLALISRYLGWPVGHIYVVTRTPEGGLAPTDIWHVEDPDGFTELRSSTIELTIGHELSRRVLETGRSVWIEDLAADPILSPATPSYPMSLRTAIATPVKANDEAVAVLEFFTSERVPRDEETLGVMENVGIQLGQLLWRERSEAALKASELRFRALAESAHDAIITADEEGRIVYCNDAVERIFGYRPDELTGERLSRIVPERLRAAHEAGLAHFRRTRDPRIMGQPIEMEGLHRNGSEVPIELVLSWWETEAGLFYTGILRDISLRKRTEAALSEKMTELAHSNAELALFGYVASHDLREPLRTVASNVELLGRRLGSVLDESMRRHMEFAIGGVQRMQALIDALLVYSRIGTEGQPFETMPSGAALEKAMDNLQTATHEAAASVTHGPLPIIRGDEGQLVQLFQNLLANSLKFHGEEPPRIHVSAVREDGEWVFAVRDNGIGIDPRYAEHIFTIFQRLHGGHEVPGTGVGLAVSRRIVERHGGRIWVESPPGQGSTFKFALPIVDGADPRS